MRLGQLLASSALALALVMGAARPANAIVVERVVAIVGDKPILQSELRNRSVPFLSQLEAKVPDGPQRAAAISQLNKDMLKKMIDEELEGQAAERAHVTITSEELDTALKNIAASQGLQLSDLFRAARTKMFFTEQYYRDEIRRQVLEGKMLQLRVKGRVPRITEQDVRQRYDKMLKEERAFRAFHPAWIVVRILPGSSPEAIEERHALATEIAEKARKGEDFAALAKKYSDDSLTRDLGGDLGIRAPNGTQEALTGQRQVLSPEIEAPVMQLEPGQIAAPLKVADAFVIVKLMSRAPSRFGAYEQSKGEVLNLLQAEFLEKSKRKWLEELKTRTHVVVRM
jgi:peptidyl-prolyl cis-trans isomerase SurA